MVQDDESAYRAALAGALRILSVRDHSVAELTRKLARRGHAEDVVQAVVAECRRLSYLDDRRSVGQAIDRLKRKGCGVQRIRRELAQKGLAGASAEEQLRGSFGPGEERAVALAAARRKWKTLQAEPDPRKRVQRLQRFLYSRGFSEGIIYAVTEEVDALNT
jgi:regulatory protein